MTMTIIGNSNRNTLYCTGSFTKMLTTFVCLSKYAQMYNLEDILDDDHFFEQVATNPQARNFLHLFQKLIGSEFSLHDICSYYAGLPYTFDISDDEINLVENNHPLKHHSVMDEKKFLDLCQHNITPVYKNRCKFHYSEISIIFLGYITEKIFNTSIEELYKEFLLDKFYLSDSLFSRTKPAHVRTIDFSSKYDYPAIAIQDHGYFCYSNGFYTTLNDQKKLLENIFLEPVFKFMSDIKHARAASNRLMNGLTLEIRQADNDVIIGYEGLSYSGCNIWAYSYQRDQGYLTFIDSEEDAYTVIYDEQFGYHDFDKVPLYTQTAYNNFIKHYDHAYEDRDIPHEYQGNYHRVNINDFNLTETFIVGKNFITIRNPDMITYPVIYFDHHYCIKNKDNVHGSKVGFHTARSGNKYMFFDGNLYRMI